MTSKKLSIKPAIAARKSPKQKRSKITVETILEAATRILEDGSGSITTNHIARRAGVSIGSLYQYFPNIDAIMAALIKNHVADEQAAAEAILLNNGNGEADMMRDLLVAFVGAHARAPRLTARLHALAPGFGLQNHLDKARNEQAARIAQVAGLPEPDVQISVMAVEGVVLAMLASDPARLKTPAFIDKLFAIALAPLDV